MSIREDHPPSGETDDPGTRTPKKAKANEMEDLPMAEPPLEEVIMVEQLQQDPKIGDSPLQRPRTVSYKDTLLQLNGDWEEKQEEAVDWMEEQRKAEEEETAHEEIFESGADDLLNPNIEPDVDDYMNSCKKWSNTLIFKMMGKRVGTKFLWNRLQKLWSLKGSFKFINLENGFHAIRFADMEDYNHVLEQGPWIVTGHYITIQKWKMLFNPYDDSVKKQAVWVRISGLPLELYTVKYLTKVGNKLGRTIKIDPDSIKEGCTEEEDIPEKGRFARLCIEVDLNKTLISKFRAWSRQLYVGYEGLHLICFFCGTYGHRCDQCILNPDNKPKQENHPNTENCVQKTEGDRENVIPDLNRKMPEEDSFGSWSLVQKHVKSRRTSNGYPRNKEASGSVGGEASKGFKKGMKPGAKKNLGSRFAVLEEDKTESVILGEPSSVPEEKRPSNRSRKGKNANVISPVSNSKNPIIIPEVPKRGKVNLKSQKPGHVADADELALVIKIDPIVASSLGNNKGRPGPRDKRALEVGVSSIGHRANKLKAHTSSSDPGDPSTIVPALEWHVPEGKECLKDITNFGVENGIPKPQ